jgi:predicted nucleotidyltransferase
MDIPERIQYLVNHIAQHCRQQFDNKAILIWFGSWVKGNARLQSDIDLAIDYHSDISQADKLAFYDWLDELPTLYHIDLVELQYADANLKTEIMRYGKKL